MTSFNHTSHISQHLQLHVGAKLAMWLSMFFDLTTMLVFKIIMNIVSFDVNHNGHY